MAAAIGQNTVVRQSAGTVIQASDIQALTGIDVAGFEHSVSNQAFAHVIRQHGNAGKEQARGQKAIVPSDFEAIPAIVSTGQYSQAEQRSFGPPRIQISAYVNGSTYTYVAEVRAGQRRIDMVTMWKR